MRSRLRCDRGDSRLSSASPSDMGETRGAPACAERESLAKRRKTVSESSLDSGVSLIWPFRRRITHDTRCFLRQRTEADRCRQGNIRQAPAATALASCQTAATNERRQPPPTLVSWSTKVWRPELVCGAHVGHPHRSHRTDRIRNVSSSQPIVPCCEPVTPRWENAPTQARYRNQHH
jgi:hypothetical protein